MPKEEQMNITVMGLGKMGSVLAKRLLAAKFNVTLYNRTQSKIQPLLQFGAKGASTAKSAVEDAEIVLTCLLDDDAVLQVTEDFMPALKPGAIHLSTSTILPETSKKLTALHAAKDSIFVVGNVLGVPKAAIKGELTSIVAGNSQAIEKCKPVFKAYSQKIINVGEQPFEANVVKICMNYFLVSAIETMGELYTFAEKSHVNTDIINVLFHSIFSHPAFKLYIDKVKSRNFDEVNFDLKGGVKDLNLFQRAFENVKVVPNIANLIKEKMTIAIAHDMLEKDWSAFTEVTRKEANI